MTKNTALPKWIIGLIVGIALVVTVVCVLAFSYGNIYPNVTVAGIDVGTLSVADAAALLTERLGDGTTRVTLEWQDYDGAPVAREIAFVSGFDATEAAQAAHNVGRNGGGGLFGSLFTAKEADYTTSVDDASLADAMRSIADEIHVEPSPFRSSIDGSGINFTAATDGRLLDLDAATQRVRAADVGAVINLDDLIFAEVMELPDADSLLANIEQTLKNAEFVYEIDEETERITAVTVTDSSPGVSFDTNEALRLLGLGEDFSLPITSVEPENSKAELEELLFRDLLASSKTTLNKYNYNRTGNVKLSAAAISECILRPGDVFSYNKVVGERTRAAGYRDASVYVSSGIEDQLGGGICQTSSTLYMSVIRSRLEIVERANHAYTVVYAPLGEDATVYWGSIDFKFKNSRDYPVKIVAWQEDDYVVVELWGTDVDGYTVETEVKISASNPYSTVQRENPNLEYGKTRQAVEGHSGYTLETFVIVKDKDGNQVDYYKLNNSRYNRLNRVLEVGTMGAPVVTPTEPSEPVSTTPTETAPPVTEAPPVESTPPVTETPPVETTPPPAETPLIPAGHE